MGHLYNDLGARYISDFYQGAYFSHEGKLYKFNHATVGGAVDAYPVLGNYETGEYEFGAQVTLKADIISSFSTFMWPKMGYRNVKLEDSGVVMSPYIQGMRSTRRGLSEESLVFSYDPATRLLLSSTYLGNDRTASMYAVFFPVWYTYAEALRLLKQDKAVSVALNEDVAITHHVLAEGDGVLYDVMFRDRVVGHVLQTGDIVYQNKSIGKMNMFKKLLINKG